MGTAALSSIGSQPTDMLWKEDVRQDKTRPRRFLPEMIDFFKWYKMIREPGYDSVSRNKVLVAAIKEMERSIEDDPRWTTTEERRGALARRVDIGGFDEDAWSPLHYAGWWADVEMARILLDAGANPSQVDENGNTPLHWACGCPQMMIDLLKRGANIHAKNHSGETALHYATNYGFHDGQSVPILLNVGLSLQDRNTEGLTVLGATVWRPSSYTGWRQDNKRRAFERSLARMVSLLTLGAAAFETSTEKHHTVQNDHNDKGHAEKGHADKCQNALHFASRMGNIPAVLLLLQFQVTIDVKEKGLHVLQAVSLPISSTLRRVLLLNGHPLPSDLNEFNNRFDRETLAHREILVARFGSQLSRLQFIQSHLDRHGMAHVLIELVLQYSPHPIFDANMQLAPDPIPLQPHLYPLPDSY
jgi:Ankyrin repeats (many copies)